MNLSYLPYKESRTNQKQRKHILKTSMQLMQAQGINGTTMVEIAKAADITRRTVYNYYDTKEEIAADIQIIALEELSWLKVQRADKSSVTQKGLEDYAEYLLKEKKDFLTFSAIYDFYMAGCKQQKAYKNYLRKHPSTGQSCKTIKVFQSYLQRLAVQNADYEENKENISSILTLLIKNINKNRLAPSLC